MECSSNGMTDRAPQSAVLGERARSYDPTDSNELPALLEALLLVSPEPADLRDLANAAGVSVSRIEQAIRVLNADETRGWVIVRHKQTVHLSSAPRFATQVRQFLHLDREARLSGAALETLALIAYRQPVTRAEIDALRGVDSSGVLATLHARGLIELAGRLPSVGNPIQYATSIEFLRHFGLSSLDDLPALGELAEHIAQRLDADEAEGSGYAEVVDERVGTRNQSDLAPHESESPESAGASDNRLNSSQR